MSMEWTRMVMISCVHWDGTATDRQRIMVRQKVQKNNQKRGIAKIQQIAKAQKQYSTRAELRTLKSPAFRNKAAQAKGT